MMTARSRNETSATDPALREWLQEFSTEYLVETVHAMKNELLRRGLDECGLPMPMLRVGPPPARRPS